MAARVFVAGLALSMLLACGCVGKGDNPAAEKAAREQRFQRLLDSGKKALEEQRFEESVKEFEEAVQLQDDSEARELLLKARTSWDEARKAAFDRAMLRGGQARKEKNYAEAIAAYRDALKQRPNDKEAAAAFQDAEFHDFLENGRAAIKNQQYSEAVKALAEAVKRQPQDKESRELLKLAQEQRRQQVIPQGQAAMQANQYAEAVRCFTEAKELRSDAEVAALLVEAKFQLRLQSGRQHLESRQFAAAITDLEEAARLKPDNAVARDLLPKAREQKKRQDRADCDHAVAVGDTAMLRKDYQAAINAYREALVKQPQDGTASTKLTQAENAQKAKIKKESVDRHMSQGKSYMSVKNYAAAVAEFRAALTDGVNNSEAQRLLQEAQKGKAKKDSYDRHISAGKSYNSSKNYSLAESEFRAALNEGVNNSEAQGLLNEAQRLQRQTPPGKR